MFRTSHFLLRNMLRNNVSNRLLTYPRFHLIFRLIGERLNFIHMRPGANPRVFSLYNISYFMSNTIYFKPLLLSNVPGDKTFLNLKKYFL